MQRAQEWRREGSRKSAHVIIGKGQNTRRPVVGKVNKHVIVGAAAKNKTKQTKVRKGRSVKRVYAPLWSGTLPSSTCLFKTFPEPPLTREESPFSTARKFSGVTCCGRTRGHKSTSPSQQNPFEERNVYSGALICSNVCTEALTSPV